MCGIVGVVAFRETERTPETLQTMLQTLQHRGPDDNGHHLIDSAALGFQRLAILDLATGQQPMQSQDGRYTIVFNGEIYNFAQLRRELETNNSCRFITNSDTEIILQAYGMWGYKAFGQLNGMFAFAIWDSQEKSLTIARDRSGKKPLYYYKGNGCFLFASEAKALLAHPSCPCKVSLNKIAASLTHRYIPGAELGFDEIETLMPGHWMRIDASGNIVKQPTMFWGGLPASTPHITATKSHLISELTKLLQGAVDRRLVADVPIGAFLSGGVDSSLLVAIMSKSLKGFKTFSVGFKDGISEHAQAAAVARKYGTDHHEILLDASDMLKEITKVLWHRESPIAEPSDIPLFVLSRYASQHVKVVLSGEGCDELFGGYPKYVAEYHMRNVPAWLRYRGAGLLKTLMPAGGSSRLVIAAEGMQEIDPAASAARWFGAFSQSDKRCLLSKEMLQHDEHAVDSIHPAHTHCPPRLSRLQQMQALDFHNWLPANLLLRGDRMTMAHSLELRCPYLDPAIVDFAFKSVPDNLKVRGLTSKWILRQVARQFLPESVAKRRKWGFKVPVGRWMRNEMRESLRLHLLSPEARRRGYYNMHEVERLLAEHIDGNKDHTKQLWYLWQLELWHLMFIDRVHPDL